MNKLVHYGSSSESDSEPLGVLNEPKSIPKLFPNQKTVEPKQLTTEIEITSEATPDKGYEIDIITDRKGISKPNGTPSPKKLANDHVPIEMKSELYQILAQQALLSSKEVSRPRMSPDESLQKRILDWMNLKVHGKHFNEQLKGNHTFRNPMIMNKMVEFMQLDSTKTKLTKFKDVLLKQDVKMEEPPPKKARTEKSGLYDHFTKAKGPQPKGRKRRI